MLRLIPALRSTLVTLDRQYVLPLGTKMPGFRHFPGPGMIMYHPPSMEWIFFFLSPMCYVIVRQGCPTFTVPKQHVSANIAETSLIFPNFQTGLIFWNRGEYKKGSCEYDQLNG